MLNILSEPQGALYRDLLRVLAPRSASFSLTWRSDAKYARLADVIREQLLPHLLRTDGTSTWPGTDYRAGLATVRHYRVNLSSLAVLETASGLYSWQAPERPEDLAFYAETGAVLLGSIAHENDAWLEGINEDEMRVLLPELSVEERSAGADA